MTVHRRVDPRRPTTTHPRLRFATPAGMSIVVVVVVAVVGAVLLFGPRGFLGIGLGPSPLPSPTIEATPSPTIEATPTPTVEPTATPTVEPTPTPVPAWAGLEWSEGVISFPQRPPVYPARWGSTWTIQSVIQWGGAYVAAGKEAVNGEAWPAFYRSDDGLHWEKTELGLLPDLKVVEGDREFDQLTMYRMFLHEVDGRLVAFARSVLGYKEGDLEVDWRTLAVGPWTSTDGSNWALAEDANLLDASTGVYVRDSASGSAGIVIIGSEHQGDDIVVLHSPDGRVWSRTSVPDAQVSRLLDVVATPDGFALGGQISDAGELGPAAWYSTDGRSWLRAEVQPLSLSTSAPKVGDDAALAKVLVGSDGLWAIGVRNWAHVAWVSSDGRAWRFVDPSEPIPSFPVVASDGNRMVMLASTVGVTPSWCLAGSADTADAAWVSTDGVQWSALSLAGSLDVKPECEWGSGWGPVTGDFVVIGDDSPSVWVAGDRVIVARGVGEVQRDQIFWVGTAKVAK